MIEVKVNAYNRIVFAAGDRFEGLTPAEAVELSDKLRDAARCPEKSLSDEPQRCRLLVGHEGRHETAGTGWFWDRKQIKQRQDEMDQRHEEEQAVLAAHRKLRGWE